MSDDAMTQSSIRLDAVIAVVEAQQRLTVAEYALSEASISRRDADAALRDAWAALTSVEQALVNQAYQPGGVTVEVAA